jgi:DNA-binding NtrC family response regulator
LRDLGSTNGTRAGAVVVRDASLAGGEEIRLGATVLLARRGAASTAELGTDVRFGRLIGVSREMRRLFPLLRRLAAADLAVVVEGETGSGRQTVAETLHESGPRASGAFVVLDCAACSDAGEDEIADAVARARGGTLFLDEPSELSAALQPKLVRALGAAEDVRLVSGTRVDLEEAVVSRRLRDDLYHRISVARVELPPLRARAGDLSVLVAHFCHELGGDPACLPATTLATWKTLTWPGNLRELRNAVAKQLVLGELAQLEPTLGAATRRADDWIERILEQKLVLADARAQVVEEFERRYVEYMLRATNGNVARAAAASGVARRYFQILKARRA